MSNEEQKSLQQIVDEMSSASLEVKLEPSISEIQSFKEEAKEEPKEREFSAIEKEALAMDWVPLDQYQGDKDNWVDAKEFVRVGKLIRARDEKTKKLESEIKELKGVTESVLASMKKAEQQAYDRALKDLEARLTRAKQIGDVDEALEINKQQIELQHNIQAQAEPQQQQSAHKDNPAQSAELKEFAASEKWITGTDRMSLAMRTVATEISNEFARLNPNASLKDELEHVRVEMRKEFPQYYEKNEPSPAKQAVLSSTSTKPASSLKGKSGIEALGPDERKIVDFLKSKGYDPTSYIETMTKL